jgi:ribosomal protein L24E
MTLPRFELMLRNQTFFFKLGKVAKFYEGYCKKKVAMMKENEEKVKWTSKEAQILSSF